jgi:hypothetical protein
VFFFGTSATNGFSGDQQSRNRGRVLDRHTNDLRRVDDALGDEVAVFAGLRVEPVGILLLLQDLADDDGAARLVPTADNPEIRYILNAISAESGVTFVADHEEAGLFLAGELA